MSSVCIITARSGSKRIPKKKIRLFCGKPIIAYSIIAALESKCFDEVMVSTDSQEIADIAKGSGARIPFLRSKENSNDLATTADALLEVLLEYEKAGCNFDYGCCIYPTAPFVTGDRIRDGMKRLENSGADSVVSIVAYSFPPQRAFRVKDGRISYIYPEHERTRSQDLEKIYHDAGQFYCFNISAFEREQSLICRNSVGLELDPLYVQDIDTEDDWRLAEIKYERILGVAGGV